MSDPLRIYEVLEEEFERLQGRPSDTANPDDKAEVRLKKIIKENHKQQLSAICLSGGGIRSATFGLGVLQGLAHNKLLSKFSYISTVSGGGYIGGWLSAWIRRHPKGMEGVEHDLPSEHPKFLLKTEPEPAPTVKRGRIGLRVIGRNEQRSAISTVEASASGMSANSTAISARVLKR